jgi:hypothetical protein
MIGLRLDLCMPPLIPPGGAGASFSAGTIPAQSFVTGAAILIDLGLFFAYNAGSILYAVAPALPAGLALSGGRITGSSVVAVPAQSVTVTATASGGALAGQVLQRSFTLTIATANQPPAGVVTALAYDVPPRAGAAPAGVVSTVQFDVEAA